MWLAASSKREAEAEPDGANVRDAEAIAHKRIRRAPACDPFDAVLTAIFLVDDVGAGGGDRDELELRQLGQGVGGQRNLVVDDDGRVFRPFHHLIGIARMGPVFRAKAKPSMMFSSGEPWVARFLGRGA